MTGPFARVIVDLTGGKDTRVLLAGVIAAGLRDRVRFRTVGPRQLADVQVARQLADRFGLDHEVLGVLPQEQVPYSDMLADFVARTGGMSNIWNAVVAALPVMSSAFRAFRVRCSAPTAECRDSSRPPRILIGYVRNRVLRSELDLVGPDARSTFEQIAMEDVLESEPNLEPAERLHLFFLRHRVRFARYGPLEEVSTEARVHPLYSLDGLSTALALGAPEREAEAIHRRLVEQVSHELADLPFAGKGWPEVKKPGPPAASTRPAGAGPTDSPSKAEPLMARAMRTSFARRREVLGDVLSDLHNDAWSVLDRPAVVRAFDRFDSLGALGRQELHGALTCCLWLGSVGGDRSRNDVEQS